MALEFISCTLPFCTMHQSSTYDKVQKRPPKHVGKSYPCCYSNTSESYLKIQDSPWVPNMANGKSYNVQHNFSPCICLSSRKHSPTTV